MANAYINGSTVIIGPTDKVAEAALELAEAARINAKAILEIAKALQGPERATGVYVAGDVTHRHEHPRVWRGEGFFGTEGV
jgi:hypothetical protein